MKWKHDNAGRQHRTPGGDVSRRSIIGLGVAGLTAFLLPGARLANAWIQIASEPARRAGQSGGAPDATSAVYRSATWRTTDRRQYVRSLAFYNLHTGENLNTAYWESGEYIPTALREINYLFRDFRANEIKEIDPRLLDVLYDLQSLTGSSQPISLVSGYRTYATNAMLAAHSEGVARHSMHIEGKASDIRIQGVELRNLQRAALSLGAGGVGYYPQSNFVHVDTGRVRHWG